ncbi:MAG: hypothetical protein IT395_00905 [Candidatus Omnitrophica bacterium]|nr:hypothetical protein [Candidatus Omnitrophota bacterium]
MRKLLNVLCVFALINSLGCSQHRVKPSAPIQAIAPLKDARIFKPEQLAKGGNLLVVPFSAGAGVEASDELDRLSLLIVKGIADVLAEHGQQFKLLAAQDAQSADMVIKGRIIEVVEKTGLSKPWGKKPKYLRLTIEGSVLGVENDDILAKFTEAKEIKGKNVRFEGLGYEIGVAIGHFLLSGQER